MGGALLLVCGFSALAWLLRGRRWPLVGWLWFAGMLVPVIGLVPIGVQATFKEKPPVMPAGASTAT